MAGSVYPTRDDSPVAGVHIEHGRDNLTLATLVEQDLVVGIKGIPVEHGSLLEIPGVSASDDPGYASRPIHQADGRRFFGIGQMVLKIGLEAEQLGSGPVPRCDSVVAEEVVPRPGRQGPDAKAQPLRAISESRDGDQHE